MLYMALIVCGWVAISVAVHTGLWRMMSRRSGNIGMFVCDLVASAFLSPGVVVGHGVLPFPGGLAFLFGDNHPGDRSVLFLNFALWMVTWAVLSAHTAYLKKTLDKR
jgi:hypothetical protein